MEERTRVPHAHMVPANNKNSTHSNKQEDGEGKKKSKSKESKKRKSTAEEGEEAVDATNGAAEVRRGGGSGWHGRQA